MMLDRKRRERTRVFSWLAVQLLTGLSAIGLIAAGLLSLPGAVILMIAGLIVCDLFMRSQGGVPVLVYHSVSADQDWLPWSDQIAVTPEGFERNIRLLKRHKFTVIRNDEFLRRRQSGEAMPHRPVVLHLDDGYLDNWVAAVPILCRHQVPGTIMVSLDFIEPAATDPRPTLEDVWAGRCTENALDWRGYLNWAEIEKIEETGLVDIQAHGIDHGRVETGAEVVDHVRSDNWRQLAWLQWRAMPGSKSGWYRAETPPYVDYGTPVQRNAPALAARAYENGARESRAAFRERVRQTLEQSRAVLGQRLRRQISLFCWPENAVVSEGHDLALAAGYLATTGGRGENRPKEDPTVVSRVHAGDRAIGWRSLWIDDLRLLAACRAFQGCYYWCFVLFAIHGCRRTVTRLNRSRGKAAAV